MKLGRAGEAIRGGLLNFLEGGAPIRSGFAGLLRGDVEPLKQAVGYGQPFPQLTPEQMQQQAYNVALDINNPMQNVGGLLGAIKLKSSGFAPKNLTQDVVLGLDNLPKNPMYDAAGNLFDDMQGRVSLLSSGDYLGRYEPRWGSASKPFYAVGDDPIELGKYLLKRNAKSDKIIKSVATKKAEKSFLGMLKNNLGATDDQFDFGKSTQSRSQYITHKPTNTKIRISDHDLPLSYEQPDLDLRSWMTDEEKLQKVLDYFNNKQN